MANGNQKIWVSDIIGNDYKKWSNEFVVLDSGTGCGKTYFCLNVLGKYARVKNKRILYLCNRRKLRQQVYDDVIRLGLRNVYVTSYQALQKDIQSGKRIIKYDYIIADECHYFMTDATFNDYTDVSYKFVMEQKESVVLLISATAKIFFRYLLDTNRVKRKNTYCLDKNYSYVNKLYYYQSDELISIINDILENEPDSKIIVFCNVGERIIEMHKIYKDDAQYYCSKSTKDKKLKEICGWTDEDKQNDCIKHYSKSLITFDKRILFTTSVLDNGIDLKDEHIKHIFTEIIDVDTMIQSLGRKRWLETKTDMCTFYVRVYQRKGIQGFINRTNNQLEPAQLYKEDYQKFYQQYGQGKNRSKIQNNKIFYSYFREKRTNAQIKFNECKYRKYMQDYNMFTSMKEVGHMEYLNDILPQELVEKSELMVVNVEQIDLFMEYLKSIEGKNLYKEEQKYIKDEFETIGVTLRYTGINTFNGALDDVYKELYLCRFFNKDINGKPLVDKRRKLADGTVNANRDKKYWILEERNIPP